MPIQQELLPHQLEDATMSDVRPRTKLKFFELRLGEEPALRYKVEMSKAAVSGVLNHLGVQVTYFVIDQRQMLRKHPASTDLLKLASGKKPAHSIYFCSALIEKQLAGKSLRHVKARRKT